jgi:hypothetical protein
VLAGIDLFPWSEPPSTPIELADVPKIGFFFLLSSTLSGDYNIIGYRYSRLTMFWNKYGEFDRLAFMTNLRC